MFRDYARGVSRSTVEVLETKMTEMRRNVLINATSGLTEEQYREWVASLKRNDFCFVQELIEGRVTHRCAAVGSYFKYRLAKIIWGSQESSNGEIAVQCNGRIVEVPATGVWEPQFGIKRLVPRQGFDDVEYGIGINDVLYEPRVCSRSAQRWIVPISDDHIAAKNGAIVLLPGSHQSLVLHPEKPSPNALRF